MLMERFRRHDAATQWTVHQHHARIGATGQMLALHSRQIASSRAKNPSIVPIWGYRLLLVKTMTLSLHVPLIAQRQHSHGFGSAVVAATAQHWWLWQRSCCSAAAMAVAAAAQLCFSAAAVAVAALRRWRWQWQRSRSGIGSGSCQCSHGGSSRRWHQLLQWGWLIICGRLRQHPQQQWRQQRQWT
jgi:hypothetical protein